MFGSSLSSAVNQNIANVQFILRLKIPNSKDTSEAAESCTLVLVDILKIV